MRCDRLVFRGWVIWRASTFVLDGAPSCKWERRARMGRTCSTGAYRAAHGEPYRLRRTKARQFGPWAPGRKSMSGSASAAPHSPPPTPSTEPSSSVTATHSVFLLGSVAKGTEVPATGST